ncbi:MAG: hypothetical protein EON59_05310 [Alphaproteobacteria bacterium]|nr:MAG: hypothetical protein EON59_05310 [Alphaproteobacteria bacterium]
MAERDDYPGARASPYELNLLADFYRDAAFRAAESVRCGDALSAAPLRLLAIQSIELNLSAFLLLNGVSALEVRRMGHDLACRVERASELGLVLRQRTAAHIAAVVRDREYLIARYGPDCLSNVSQLNRMLATVQEVATKVSQAVRSAEDRSFLKPPKQARNEPAVP